MYKNEFGFQLVKTQIQPYAIAQDIRCKMQRAVFFNESNSRIHSKFDIIWVISNVTKIHKEKTM